jgi:UDP-glucose 4-epimerase
MRVLVTGGAGFIGSNLCAQLLAGAFATHVTVLDDLSTGRAANLRGLDVEFIEGSLLDAVLVAKVVRDADAVVHLGARGSVPRSVADPVTSFHANVTGTLNVLEAARRSDCRQLIFSSSSSVYGANPELPKVESMATRPISPYAASKLAAESMVLAYGATYDVDVLAFRFFNVYGPGQPADHDYAAVIPKFVAAALRDEPLVVHGDGRQTRDFTYVGTVVETLERALVDRLCCLEPVNLAFGTQVSLLDVVRLVAERVERPVRVEHVAPRTADVRHSRADDTRLRRYFPDIEPVPLEVGLDHTLAWMTSQLVGAA